MAVEKWYLINRSTHSLSTGIAAVPLLLRGQQISLLNYQTKQQVCLNADIKKIVLSGEAIVQQYDDSDLIVTVTSSNVIYLCQPFPRASSGSSGGSSGSSAQSGYSGRSGYSGIAGNGYSGYSGFSGISGLSGLGTSGAAGFSGYSGRSGYSGAGISTLPPIPQLSGNVTQLRFLNRPNGCNVNVYKYTKYVSGPHLYRIRNKRITSVVAASTSNFADPTTLPLTIDGVALEVGDVVLLKDQTSTSENDTYVVDTIDTAAHMSRYAVVWNAERIGVYVLGGTINEDTAWIPDGTNWFSQGDPVIFETPEDAGVTRYSNRLGKRWRFVANLGQIDEWTPTDYYSTNVSSSQYYFRYQSGSLESLPSPIIHFSRNRGNNYKNWRQD